MLYIAGWGRSGSTVLTAILGQLEGVFAAGEVRSLWARGLVDGRLCGCGRPVPNCPLWCETVGRTRATMTAPEMAAFQRAHLRTRHYPYAWLRLAAGRPTRGDASRYVDTYVATHAALAEVTGGDIVIDSSKYPLDLWYLSRDGRLDLRVVHLVRDPRSTAASWAAPKPLDDGHDGNHDVLRRIGPASSSLIWSTWNLMISGPVTSAVGVDRVMRLRYEDFVAEPEATVGAIAAFAGIGSRRPPIKAGVARVAPTHMVAGNADRFTTGSVPVRNGPPAGEGMRARDRLLATAPALPLMARYGYRLRPAHH